MCSDKRGDRLGDEGVMPGGCEEVRNSFLEIGLDRDHSPFFDLIGDTLKSDPEHADNEEHNSARSLRRHGGKTDALGGEFWGKGYFINMCMAAKR